MGALTFATMSSYSLGFWYGSHCVEGDSSCPISITGGKYQGGDVLTIFFCIMIAGFNLSQLTPSLKKIA
jgi:hypothetical protein